MPQGRQQYVTGNSTGLILVGLHSYYKRFIQRSANIVRVLHKLIEQRAAFDWSHDCQQYFQTLQHVLLSVPVLCYPRFSKIFVLDTDVSNESLGGILSHTQDGKEKVIVCVS